MLEAEKSQKFLERVAFLLADAQNLKHSRRLKSLSEGLVAHWAAQLKFKRLEEAVLHALDKVGQPALDAAE